MQRSRGRKAVGRHRCPKEQPMKGTSDDPRRREEKSRMAMGVQTSVGEGRKRSCFFLFVCFVSLFFLSKYRHPSGSWETLPRLFQILVEPFLGSLRAFITDQECNQASLQLLQSLTSITEVGVRLRAVGNERKDIRQQKV